MAKKCGMGRERPEPAKRYGIHAYHMGILSGHRTLKEAEKAAIRYAKKFNIQTQIVIQNWDKETESFIDADILAIAYPDGTIVPFED